MSLGWALDPQLLSDPQERAFRPARRPLDPHLMGQLFESLQRVVSLRERPHQLLRVRVSAHRDRPDRSIVITGIGRS
ncbi:MAG: hypothetical protein ACREM3_31495 [Candidatus Rokuibacteriota bacterium]